MAETKDEEVLVPQVEATTEETPVETTETTQEVVDAVETESFEEDPDYKDFYTGTKPVEGDKVSAVSYTHLTLPTKA